VNYTSIENDIVARLAPLVTAGYDVEAMPDNQSSNVGIGRRGRITVQVTMAKFGEHKANAPAVVQDEDIYIDIILRARTLRAVGGIYDLCELCRARLIGYVPNNCDIPLSGVDFGGIDPREIADSVFMYSLRLKTRTHSVGGPDVDILPLITAITFDDQTTSSPPPTAELFASSYFVASAGQQVILAWATFGADEVTITGLGVVDDIGSATVTISADTTFTLTVVQGVTTITSSVEIVIGDPFAPATYTLEDTDGNTLSTGSIPSGGSADIVAPDGTVLRDGQPYGSVLSGGTIDVPSAVTPCADATVELNGVEMATIASGDTENIEVRQSTGSTLVGSQQGQYWRIGDSEISINGTPVEDVQAEDSLDIPVIQDGSPAGSWNGTQWVIPSCPQDLTIRIEVALAADAFTFTATANEAGTITSVNDGGLTSFVLSLNAAPVTAPFTIANGDVISAAFTAAGSATTVTLTGTY
jgi:hypothetical protein